MTCGMTQSATLLVLDCYVLPSLTKVIVIIIITVYDDNDNDFVLFSSIYFFYELILNSTIFDSK